MQNNDTAKLRKAKRDTWLIRWVIVPLCIFFALNILALLLASYLYFGSRGT